MWLLGFFAAAALGQTMYGLFPGRKYEAGFPGERYPKEWKTVDSLEEQGLVKQAADRVAVIYGKAKAARNTPQLVKSLIYKIKYGYTLEENSTETFIADLDKEIADADPVLKSILYSLKGELLWSHYQINRWSINERTATDAADESMDTWDAARFMRESRGYYLLSLKEAEAEKKIPIGELEDILVTDSSARIYRPTLYDFLAHRAIDFLMNAEADLSRPSYAFELDEPSYFAPCAEFIRLKPASPDSDSPELATLLLFRDLLSFHKESPYTAALLDADIKRLDYVKSKYVGSGKETLHLDALKALEARFKNKKESADVTFKLAQVYRELGGTYTPADGDTEKKYYLKKAVEACTALVSAYPDTRAAHNAKVLRDEIMDASFSFTIEKSLQPDVPNLLLFRFQNVKKAYFRLVAVDYKEFNEAYERPQTEEKEFNKWLSGKPAAKTWEQALPDDGLFHPHTAELGLEPLKKGFYVLMVNGTDDFSAGSTAAYASFFVSNLSYIKRAPFSKGNLEVVVMDRETGIPVKGAEVKLFQEKYDYTSRRNKNQLLATLKTDASGSAVYVHSSEQYLNLNLAIRTKDDFLADGDRIGLYKTRDREESRVNTSIFTDRGIYRPGQTVYFKGVQIRTTGEKNELVTNTVTEVTVRDANYQELTKIKLPVNEFGSFQGSFTIPQGLATGMFTVTDSHGGKSIRVEEYKRPKFEVTVEKPKEVFRVNDKVTIKGNAKALAGYNVTGAKVRYRVFRSADYPVWYRYWFPFPKVSDQEMASGETKTDGKGAFEITFEAIPDKTVDASSEPTFSYRVNVEVTDDAGETRTADETVTAGFTTLTIDAGIPDLQDRADVKRWPIRVSNLNGQVQKMPVQVKVERLQRTAQPYRSKLWEKPDVYVIPEKEYHARFPYDVYKNENTPLSAPAEETVYEGTFNTADSLGFSADKYTSWKPGAYRVVVSTKDPFGKDVKSVSFFTLYGDKEKTSPVNEFFVSKQINPTVEPGSQARFYLASGKNIRVLFEVEHRNKVIRKEWISISNEQRIVSLPVTEDYRGDIQVMFTVVVAGRSYQQTFTVNVPYTDKELQLKLESFRDKMLPGSREEWKINVSPLLGERQTAELLLGMYDASLDAFVANDWFLNVWNSRYGIYTWSSGLSAVKGSQIFNYDNSEKETYSFPEYEQLNYFGSPLGYSIGGGFGAGSGFLREEYLSAVPARAEDLAGRPSLQQEREKKAENDQEQTVAKPRTEGNTGTNGGSTDVKARSNFNETAFFFPQVKTDAGGNAIFSFTMPESLTKWKFMALAHTKTLQTGTLTKEVVTQKELMINTFAPRFLREGDDMVFSAKITNLTAKELTGKAVLELKDPVTDKPVANLFGLERAEIAFSVKAGESVLAEWKIKIPFGANLVKYTVKAVSGNFSDGEENVLPVLTNKISVTETAPLWVNGNDTKNFSLPKLNTPSATRQNIKLTLEFTSNPAWYAIQALPYLMEYPYECAEQTFSRFYANSIATHIANSDPKIKAVFDTWKNYQPQVLQSKLETNPDLKNVLLEESPWVREAVGESERKRRVGILFDLNRMSAEMTSAQRKLKQMQTPNGGFPWFDGGRDDRYITQYIVTGFGKLRRLGSTEKDADTREMVRRAIIYLDQRIADDYRDLVKHKTDLSKDNLGIMQVHYLYARSFFKDIPVDEKSRSEAAYYAGQAEKFWNKKDDYAMGMLALAMHRADKKAVAKQIIASLKDRSIYNEELGMYWKGMLQGGYYWYNAPIENMALMIEAFDEAGGDTESVDRMRRWLLKNKQTNDWKTTKATADASYALLLRGTQYLMTDPGVEIGFGKNGEVPFVLPAKTEAGTGYFKTDFDKNEIKPQMANIRVTKTTAGPGWGAMYWQYMEDMDKVTKPATPNPLSVSKKLFKEVKTDRGLKLEEITVSTVLEPGDRIISRIILNSDRPMEYVHLKDMRASGLEPENVLSEYKWKQGLGYYESTKDVATHFFISYVPRGTYVFEYPSRATHRGNFSNGITQVQCMYAPEFTFHSEGVRINIK